MNSFFLACYSQNDMVPPCLLPLILDWSKLSGIGGHWFDCFFFSRKIPSMLIFFICFFSLSHIGVVSTLLYINSSLSAGNREVTSNLSTYLETMCSSSCYHKDKNMHIPSKVYLRIFSGHDNLYSFSLLETGILLP